MRVFQNLKQLARSPFMRFLVVGGINTLFGYLCYMAAIGLIGLSLSWALLASQLAGIIFNFKTYGRLIFNRDNRQNNGFIFLRFIGAYAITYGLNLLLLKWLILWTISPYLAQIAALTVVVPVSYILLRRFVWS